MTENELKKLERSTFRAAVDSGLWDMFLASVVAMFAVAPLLSSRLGDFWSSAIFVPAWAAAYLGIRVVQIRVLGPRLGVVRFAPARQKRLKSLGIVMLAVNVAVLILGIVAATQEPTVQAEIVPLSFSMILLLCFSLVAFFLEIPRVFLYGLLLAGAPPTGEVLFQRGYAAHHGFPVTFGVCALVILVSGIVRFKRFLPSPARKGGDG